ncbi:MAG: hypothetical protein WKG00_22540 [Polyangiaceae bacterium]
MIKTIASLLPLLLVAACSSSATGGGSGGPNEPNDPDDPKEALVGCLPVTTTPIGLDEPTALGFTAAELLDLADGDHQASLAWDKGGSTSLDVSVTADAASARYVERAWQDDGSGTAAEPAIDCPDVIEIDAVTGFATEDGAFAESWTTTLSASEPGLVLLGASVAPDAIAGSYQVTEVDPAQYDELTLFFDVAIDAGGATGAVAGQAVQGSNSPDPDGVVSATRFSVAAF